MQSYELAILNRTTTLENVVNDQVYLNNANENLRKSARPRLLEKINEKEITPKNANDLLTWRQCVIEVSESGVFSIRSRAQPSTWDGDFGTTLT